MNLRFEKKMLIFAYFSTFLYNFFNLQIFNLYVILTFKMLVIVNVFLCINFLRFFENFFHACKLIFLEGSFADTKLLLPQVNDFLGKRILSPPDQIGQKCHVKKNIVDN